MKIITNQPTKQLVPLERVGSGQTFRLPGQAQVFVKTWGVQAHDSTTNKPVLAMVLSTGRLVCQGSSFSPSTAVELVDGAFVVNYQSPDKETT